MAKPKLETIETTPPVEEAAPAEKASPIVKPDGFSLDKFKAKHTGDSESQPYRRVSRTTSSRTPRTSCGCTRMKIEYWSDDLCFVNVPVKGMKEGTAAPYRRGDRPAIICHAGKPIHYRLALATKPFDIFFLCHIPTRNLDNKYNATTLRACEQAKTMWVQLTSMKHQGIEDYEITPCSHLDAVPQPKWPSQSLGELIDKAFPAA